MLTKQEAVAKLAGYDHAFLGAEEVQKLVEPFGFLYGKFTDTWRDTRSVFKGLTLHGDNPATGKPYEEGDACEGQSADILAEELCHELGVKYRSFHGRGSQLAECAEALRLYVDANG